MTALVRYTEPAELERSGAHRSWIDAMAPAIELAKAIATTDFVPRAMRNNPAAISAAILYGDEIGVGPMQSLNTIAVIEGHPTLLAKMQRALVLAAGHEIWPEESTPTRATWCGRRRGSDQVTRITWTMDDARRAGLERKQNWRTYPRQMLTARASAELVGAIFGDVVGGLLAFEEIEAGDELAAGAVDTPGAATRGGGKRRRPRAAVGVAAAAPQLGATPPGALPPLPHELAGGGEVQGTDPGGDPTPANAAPTPMMTDAQRRRMHALFRQRGVTDRGDRLRYSSAVLGRVITSAKELTSAEADLLCDALELEREPDPEAQRAEDQARLDAEVSEANARLHEVQMALNAERVDEGEGDQ